MEETSQQLWEKHLELDAEIDDLFLNFYTMYGPDQWIPPDLEDLITGAHNRYAATYNRGHMPAQDSNMLESLDESTRQAVFQDRLDSDQTMLAIFNRLVYGPPCEGFVPGTPYPGG